MRIFISVIIGVFLLSIAAVTGEAKSQLRTFLPCEGDFEMKVSVRAAPSGDVVSADDGDIGFQVSIPRGAKTGSLIREGFPKKEFTRERCELWQDQLWPLLHQVLFENPSKERSALVCRNIASVMVRHGQKRESAKICLSDAHNDALTAGFKRFFEGTEHLAW